MLASIWLRVSASSEILPRPCSPSASCHLMLLTPLTLTLAALPLLSGNIGVSGLSFLQQWEKLQLVADLNLHIISVQMVMGMVMVMVIILVKMVLDVPASYAHPPRRAPHKPRCVFLAPTILRHIAPHRSPRISHGTKELYIEHTFCFSSSASTKARVSRSAWWWWWFWWCVLWWFLWWLWWWWWF